MPQNVYLLVFCVIKYLVIVVVKSVTLFQFCGCVSCAMIFTLFRA